VAHLAQGGAGEYDDEFEASSSSKGSISVYCRYAGMGLLLEAGMGSVTDAGAGPYTHTFELGSTINALTLEGIRGDSGQSEVFTGCKLDEWSLEGVTKELVKLDATILAMTSAARGSAGTPSYSTGEICNHKQCGTLAFNSANYTLKKWKVAVKNSLEPIYELGSSEISEPGFGARREVIVSATLVARSGTDALYAAQLARTQGDVTWALTGTGNNAMAFTARNARLRKASDTISAPGTYEVTCEWACFADTSDSALQIVVTNDDVHYTAA